MHGMRGKIKRGEQWVVRYRDNKQQYHASRIEVIRRVIKQQSCQLSIADDQPNLWPLSHE